ncbi:MAG: helix-turn-helix domain-containing protein, partial [Magnetococcales bacterium]|nr:helix-turn-helix domain-containing protein [Magnetococcales bacterium]
MSIRMRALKILKAMSEGCKSLRNISIRIEIPKSSVHRSLEALKRRNCYPESYLWESKEGQDWLCVLVIGVLYEFGGHPLKPGQLAKANIPRSIICVPSKLG